MGAISCGSDANRIEAFFMPFYKSAAYLGMNYIGDIHTWISEEEPNAAVRKRVAAYLTKIKELKLLQST
jgi:hypothetical protein